jgi:hypothetical protein
MLRSVIYLTQAKMNSSPSKSALNWQFHLKNIIAATEHLQLNLQSSDDEH